ncbi:GNAT family N-acetyltransferase [Angustibacter luteus]|uniref:GNAT family N-acetyltransferase n=1 Tax=Angustibacter luteus TaxID=658456 RepID=A0ABW1JA98_9ACTN
MATPAVQLRPATSSDTGEVLTLQRAAFVAEAQLYGEPDIQPLRDTPDDVRRAIGDPRTHVVVAVAVDETEGRPGRLLGSARLVVDPEGLAAVVGRIVVAPDVQGRGLGSLLVQALHDLAAGLGVRRFELWTGGSSQSNLAFYRRHGYVDQETRQDDRGITLQVMRREVPAGSTEPT